MTGWILFIKRLDGITAPGQHVFFLKIAVWLLHLLLTHTKQKRNHNENSMVWSKQPSSQSKRPASQPLQWDTIEAHCSPTIIGRWGLEHFFKAIHVVIAFYMVLDGLPNNIWQFLGVALESLFWTKLLCILCACGLNGAYSSVVSFFNYCISRTYIPPKKTCPNKSFKFTINARIPIKNLLFEDCF